MTETAPPSSQQSVKLNKYGINGVARQLSMAVIIDAVLLIGAGTLDWRWGWVFSVVYFLCWAGLSVALVRWNPELQNQRGKRVRQMEGTRQWDWILLAIYSLTTVVQPFVAGLDFRYGWSSPSGDVVLIAGNVLTVISFILLTWSMLANRFFEATARIQDERKHQVISSGPYRYVRHPGYVGVIISFVSLPLALGTWVALIPGAVGVAVFLIRTALEDRMLQSELPGYAEYAQRTRYRLLPGVW